MESIILCTPYTPSTKIYERFPLYGLSGQLKKLVKAGLARILLNSLGLKKAEILNSLFNAPANPYSIGQLILPRSLRDTVSVQFSFDNEWLNFYLGCYFHPSEIKSIQDIVFHCHNRNKTGKERNIKL